VVSAAALCVQEIERELGSSSVQEGRKEVRGKHGSTDRTKFGYSQENEPLGRIALRKYRDRTTENEVL
jgi:hypothetical protein